MTEPRPGFTSARAGYSNSLDEATRGLWWHDLVDWPTTGLGPVTWDWSTREGCFCPGPDGERCALPWGHVTYLGIGHRTRERAFTRNRDPKTRRISTRWAQ